MIPRMLEVIEKLLALQDRDRRLRAFRSELDSIPAEIKTKERLIGDAASRLESAKTRAKEIEVAKKALQMETGSKRDQIAKYKTQQTQTRKNEEFTALAHEITAAEKLISEIEDRELALMEEAESLKPEIAAAEAAFTAEKQKYETQIAALHVKESNLRERIAELEAARPTATEGVDEDLLDRYERLFKTKNGAAVVALEHEVCTGCHMKVTTQTVVEVKSARHVVSCPQCGRLLHLPA
jgi:predicted  nucleic acid-binding Zn-ribbon protein